MNHPILAVDNWLSRQGVARQLRILFAVGAAVVLLVALVLASGVARWWGERVEQRASASLRAELDQQAAAAATALQRLANAVAADTALARSLDLGSAPRELAAHLQRIALTGPGVGSLLVVQDRDAQPLAVHGTAYQPAVSSPDALRLPWAGSRPLWQMLDGVPVMAVRVPVFIEQDARRHRVGFVLAVLPQIAERLRELAARRGFDALWLGAANGGQVPAEWQSRLWRMDAAMLGDGAPVVMRAGLFAFGDGQESMRGEVLQLPTGDAPAPLRLVLAHQAPWSHASLVWMLAVAALLLLACLVAALPMLALAQRYVLGPLERLAASLGQGAGATRELARSATREPAAGGDIERLRQIASALSQDRQLQRQDKALWQAVFTHTLEAIFVTDVEGRLAYVNAAYLALCGEKEAAVLGQVPRFMRSPGAEASDGNDLWSALEKQGEWRGEVSEVQGAGSQMLHGVSIVAIRDDLGQTTHYAGFFTDNSGRQEQEARIQYLAHHDTLTGLPNRARFMERLRSAIAQAQRSDSRVALLYIDLDRFKVINDTLGHAIGDELLRTVGDRLVRASESGELVSRLGGDEFVIMLNRLREAADAERAAEHILGLMAPTARVGGHELAITPSIGIAVYPDHGIDADELVRNADVAMYYAKSQGRNNYQVFSASLTESAEESLSLEHALRTAADRDEFLLYYQPQIEVATRKLVGVEALIRWNSEEFGMVSPAKFIRIAEECGLILQMGDWVLREACRQRAEWNLAGVADFPIAVNVSALQFRQPEFIRRVEEALQIYGIATSQLELELTESIVMHESGATVAALQHLREMGVALSIDDFGTGYSSLGYLKHLPIQKLKVDGAFVRGIETDKADRAIVEAIVSLGRALDLTLVAEGVEHRSTVTVLGKLGCHVAQGYYYCRPLPPDDFIAWHREFSGEGRRLTAA